MRPYFFMANIENKVINKKYVLIEKQMNIKFYQKIF